MSFKGSSTNSSLLKNSISSKKLLQDNERNMSDNYKTLSSCVLCKCYCQRANDDDIDVTLLTADPSKTLLGFYWFAKIDRKHNISIL